VGKKLMLLKKKIEGKKKGKFESRKENQLSSITLVPGSLMDHYHYVWFAKIQYLLPNLYHL